MITLNLSQIPSDVKPTAHSGFIQVPYLILDKMRSGDDLNLWSTIERYTWNGPKTLALKTWGVLTGDMSKSKTFDCMHYLLSINAIGGSQDPITKMWTLWRIECWEANEAHSKKYGTDIHAGIAYNKSKKATLTEQGVYPKMPALKTIASLSIPEKNDLPVFVENTPPVFIGNHVVDKDLLHDDDDGTHSFFATNDICGYYDFTTTTTWGNFEVSQTPLLEPIVAKDDEIEPLVIIQATPLGREETTEPAAPIVASLPVVEPAAPPQADAPISPDMAAKQALLDKLPLNPGPIRQKLLDVLPKLPVDYVKKCIQFHEIEIELNKSNYHNPLGFMISCMLDPDRPVPANTTVTEVKEKAASSTTAAKRPGQARPAKKSPIVTRSYTYNANVLGK